MRNRMGVGLRTWMLGATATGLLTVPVLAQTQTGTFSSSKKPVIKPAVATKSKGSAPVLAVTAEGTPGANPIITVSQVEDMTLAASDKSEVQRQLELLYQNDGREMPDMNLNLQPLNSTKKAPQAAAPAAPVAPRAEVAPAPTAKKPATLPSGFNKLQPAAKPVTPVAAPAQMNSQPGKNYSAAFSAQAPGATEASTTGQSQGQQPAPRPNKITGFFKRFVPVNKKSISTPPIPPDHMNPAPESALVNSVPPQAIPAMLPQPKTPAIPISPPPELATRPILSSVPLQTAPAPLVTPGPASLASNTTTSLPSLDRGMPLLAQEPAPIVSAPQPIALPPLMTEPDARIAATPSVPPLSKVAAVPAKSNPTVESSAESDFPNPFPDLDESRLEPKLNTTVDAPQIAMEPPKQVEEPQVAASVGEAAEEVAEDDSDPFAVRTKDFSEPKLEENAEVIALPTMPELTLPDADDSPKVLEAPQTANASPAMDTYPPAPPMPEISGTTLDIGALKPAEEGEEAYMEKIRRIRDRFGMKGLKGFCPVTLRDERELLDAKPEYFYTHRGQKFHFATADARNKFEADPGLYAPAAYGADVVALGRDKDVVEGTLDYAAWFKGRLYLFGNQANYETFVRSPATYASPAGVE